MFLMIVILLSSGILMGILFGALLVSANDDSNFFNKYIPNWLKEELFMSDIWQPNY